MLGFFSKRLHLSLRSGNISLINSKTVLGFTQNHSLFAFTSLSTPLNSNVNEAKLKDRSFIVSYLVNPAGFSSEIADTVSKKLGVETLANALQVVNLFRSHGFDDTQITKLLTKHGFKMISADPEKTILPKLDFLLSAGIDKSDLARLVSSRCGVLQRSLKNFLIPVFNMLQTVFPCNENVAKALIRLCQEANHDVLNCFPSNVGVLQSFGIPQPIIFQLVSHAPRLVCLKSDKFVEFVRKTIGIGFETNKHKFVDAAVVIAGMSSKTWEQRMESYRRWGLSKDEIWLGFKRFPRFMRFSEKKFEKAMKFLVNEIGWKPADVANLPYVLGCSLEKTIIPRCSVVSVLMSKRLVREEINLSSVLFISKSRFFQTYVVKYQEQIPQLLSIAEGKTNNSELGYRLEGENESTGRKARKKIKA